jgi:hypothetical protein
LGGVETKGAMRRNGTFIASVASAALLAAALVPWTAFHGGASSRSGWRFTTFPISGDAAGRNGCAILFDHAGAEFETTSFVAPFHAGSYRHSYPWNRYEETAICGVTVRRHEPFLRTPLAQSQFIVIGFKDTYFVPWSVVLIFLALLSVTLCWLVSRRRRGRCHRVSGFRPVLPSDGGGKTGRGEIRDGSNS